MPKVSCTEPNRKEGIYLDPKINGGNGEDKEEEGTEEEGTEEGTDTDDTEEGDQD